MTMHWTPELRVGVEEIDAQHRALIDRVNKLVDACAAGRCLAEVEPVMEFLRTYVARHFADEEGLMERSGYPEREGHRREHEGFRRHLEALAGRLAAEGAGAGPELEAELQETVVDWLFDHICIRDRALGKFLGAAL